MRGVSTVTFGFVEKGLAPSLQYKTVLALVHHL
jgi:hypothetical protein